MAKWTPPPTAKPVEAPPQAEFVRFANVGDSMLGIVNRFGKNDFGDFCELSPAIVIPVKGKPTVHKGVAIGLSSNLKPKLPYGLVGKPVGITFSDREPRPKGTMNVFTVHQLERDYFDGALTKMGASELVRGADKTAGVDVEDDDDDLPF